MKCFETEDRALETVRLKSKRNVENESEMLKNDDDALES
jgi:hypothetical protein